MDVVVDFFLLLSLIGVTVMWMTLFVFSIRSNLIPIIDRRSKVAQVQTITLSSSSSHESIENVIGPSSGGDHYLDILI
jgi:uncharacterized protein YpmS